MLFMLGCLSCLLFPVLISCLWSCFSFLSQGELFLGWMCPQLVSTGVTSITITQDRNHKTLS
jgi:polyferredoxin